MKHLKPMLILFLKWNLINTFNIDKFSDDPLIAENFTSDNLNLTLDKLTSDVER